MKRLELYQPSYPLERSRSCSGRIEASSAHIISHIQKPLSLRTDRPNVSRSNSLPESESDRHSNRNRPQEISEFSLRERIDISAKEVKNKDPLINKPALEFRARGLGPVTKRKHVKEKATVLPLRGLSQKAKSPYISPLPLCTVTAKRRFEREDEIVAITPNFKKTRRHTKNLESPSMYQNTVERLRSEYSDPTFKPSPSDFQASSQ